jgi:hypothetical protein
MDINDGPDPLTELLKAMTEKAKTLGPPPEYEGEDDE